MSAAAVLPKRGSKDSFAGNGRFNAEAKGWDSNPGLHLLSAEGYKAIVAKVPGLSSRQLNVLEIGCGTGLLTLMLAPQARSITAVDAAYGMIAVLEEKLKKTGVKNVVPVCELLEDPEDPALPPADGPSGARQKYDVVVSHLVLHHIPDLRGVLVTMYGCLRPGGCIALTDFEDFGPEAHKFHSKNRMQGVVRHGTNVQAMEALLREIGYMDVKCEVAWKTRKRVEKWEGEFDTPDGKPGKGQGAVMEFPFLLIYGRKPKDTKASL